MYSGAGSRPSSDKMAKQVVIASSVTPREFNDSSQLPETTYDLPDIVQPTKRKGGDTDKVIIIPVEYTAEGYNSCDSTEPILIALLRSPPRLP